MPLASSALDVSVSKPLDPPFLSKRKLFLPLHPPGRLSHFTMSSWEPGTFSDLLDQANGRKTRPVHSPVEAHAQASASGGKSPLQLSLCHATSLGPPKAKLTVSKGTSPVGSFLLLGALRLGLEATPPGQEFGARESCSLPAHPSCRGCWMRGAMRKGKTGHTHSVGTRATARVISVTEACRTWESSL